MMTMRIMVLALLLADPVTAMPAGPSASDRAMSQAAVAARLDVVRSALPHQPPIRLQVVNDPARDGTVRDGVLVLSPASVALLRGPEEIDGVLATILAFAYDAHGIGSVTRWPGVGEYLGAAAFAGAARAIDPRDPRTTPPEAQRNYSFQPLRKDALPGTAQGGEALRLFARIGTCSGAALEALARLARDPLTAPTPIGRLGKQARAGFGALALPPDRSCIARS